MILRAGRRMLGLDGGGFGEFDAPSRMPNDRLDYKVGGRLATASSSAIGAAVQGETGRRAGKARRLRST
jgi:hypothetical protein